ncbi:hypothetical protein DM45_3393 [Burkholderia mallei]|nr:hypothetical protein DM45_3393 [Burkholderia mallei]
MVLPTFSVPRPSRTSKSIGARSIATMSPKSFEKSASGPPRSPR